MKTLKRPCVVVGVAMLVMGACVIGSAPSQAADSGGPRITIVSAPHRVKLKAPDTEGDCPQKIVARVTGVNRDAIDYVNISTQKDSWGFDQVDPPDGSGSDPHHGNGIYNFPSESGNLEIEFCNAIDIWRDKPWTTRYWVNLVGSPRTASDYVPGNVLASASFTVRFTPPSRIVWQ